MIMIIMIIIVVGVDVCCSCVVVIIAGAASSVVATGVDYFVCVTAGMEVAGEVVACDHVVVAVMMMHLATAGTQHAQHIAREKIGGECPSKNNCARLRTSSFLLCLVPFTGTHGGSWNCSLWFAPIYCSCSRLPRCYCPCLESLRS